MTERTIALCHSRTSTPVSAEQAGEMLRNVIGFFATLDAIDRRERGVTHG